jgi:hypothetical protein
MAHFALCWSAVGLLAVVSSFWVGGGGSRSPSCVGWRSAIPRALRPLPDRKMGLRMTSPASISPLALTQSRISVVDARIADVQEQIAEVAASVKTVQSQIVDIGRKIEETEAALDLTNLSTEKRAILMMKLKSLMDKEAKLMDEKKSLMDKEAKLMDEKAKLMDEKAKLMDEEKSQTNRGLGEGTNISIPDTFNFNVSSWEVGQIVDCGVLSDMMRPFGGFPSKLFVREEMKAVWSIVCRGIVEERTKWVIVGSPGVGKSVLTVLASFHLARSFNRPVFLARQLKGEGEGSDNEALATVAVCIYPGGRAVGFPKHPGEEIRLSSVSAAFSRSCRGVVTVLDGWSQQEMVGTQMWYDFGGFHLLATSAQYRRKSQDVRYLVMLPAWLEADLKSLRSLSGGMVNNTTFEEQYYYSGGSAREFLRPIEDICNRVDDAVTGISSESCQNILAGYGGSPGSSHDTLRRCYLSDRSLKSYQTSRKWVYAIDSSYALRRLTSLAPLSVFKQSMEVAKASACTSLYGQMFEVFVHQLFSLPNLSVSFHLRDATEARGGYNESIHLTNYSVECVGDNFAGAKGHLSRRTMNIMKTTYWHPNSPQFPVLDAIACIPETRTVLYIQLTAAKEKVANQTVLSTIHNMVKGSLEKSLSTKGNINDWAFRYIAIEPSLAEADALKLTATDGFAVGEVTFSKGHVSYTAE